MLKRDSLTAQMQQLSHTLAKVKRLIIEDEESRALKEVEYTLAHYYGLEHQELVETPLGLFANRIREEAFKAEEISLLANFLDELAGLNDDEQTRRMIWTKVIMLFDILEKEHHVLSFEHLSRRSLLMQAINV
ncbi:hypothetical protein H8S90_03565 [Olivibacter sp. SDN3]|uniref:hypothetical protein n=1 Tax=Olivibacter sp. SDN3 TaxID=2764720 RepID=UPI001651A266|nr:hypothetical protein [Olivibacter sp. SDN3]QNL50688.1 hypothetical protein H8S90_03565 [Olivibacter sp. SDN3]